MWIDCEAHPSFLVVACGRSPTHMSWLLNSPLINWLLPLLLPHLHPKIPLQLHRIWKHI